MPGRLGLPFLSNNKKDHADALIIESNPGTAAAAPSAARLSVRSVGFSFICGVVARHGQKQPEMITLGIVS